MAYYFDTLVGATSDPARIFLGNRFSLNEPWIGGIDEFSMWNRALCLEEVGWPCQNTLRAAEFEPIPEPGALTLLGVGMVGFELASPPQSLVCPRARGPARWGRRPDKSREKKF